MSVAGAKADLDVITIGRSSVDLYGVQVGGRLEDMLSFRKYVGGSPTNMAIGAARLGLRSAVITRVGDEQMGRFIIEQLRRENVAVDGVAVDPQRLTALAVLGIRDEAEFPLLFYRENCADMALSANDIHPAFIGRARAVVATGTHLSRPQTAAACLKAFELARSAGAKTALDIDYRPNLWGLAGHDAGDERYIGSSEVTAQLQRALPGLDLIVGTEEEIHIAGGSTDTLEALRRLRELTDAALVCKRGTLGAAVFTGAVGASWDDVLSVPTEKIEVFNVLGAGDGFMGGLLRGWVTGEPWETALRWANICGALAVSRHGCAPAYPSWEELQWYQRHGSKHFALRKDPELEHVHRATNRRSQPAQLRVFAFDHRKQLCALEGATESGVGAFKRLCVKAAAQVAGGQEGYGILCDDVYGRQALYDSTGTGLWVARPVEVPGSKPLELLIEPDCGAALAEWPADHVVKVLCLCAAGDADALWQRQLGTLRSLQAACRNADKQLMLEIIAPREAPDGIVADGMQRVYEAQIRPDWWKLQPAIDRAVWQRIDELVAQRDPWCAGIVVLGQEAGIDELAQSFAAAAGFTRVRGFAVGRTVFADTAKAWFAGGIDSAGAVNELAAGYQRLCQAWDAAARAAGRKFS